MSFCRLESITYRLMVQDVLIEELGKGQRCFIQDLLLLLDTNNMLHSMLHEDLADIFRVASCEENEVEILH